MQKTNGGDNNTLTDSDTTNTLKLSQHSTLFYSHTLLKRI